MNTPSLYVHRSLWLILFAALLVRGALAMIVPQTFSMDPDSYAYDAVAKSITENGTLLPSAVRTPGYPAFLAAIHFVCGAGYRPVIIVQALLSTLSVFLVYLLGCAIWSRKTGLFAAMIVAVDPFQVYFASKMLTETLFIFLLCLIVYILTRLYTCDRPAVSWYLLAGSLLGITTLVRPEVLGLAMMTAFVGSAAAIRKRGTGRALGTGALLLLATLAVLLPWGIRNQKLLGRFILTSTNGGWTMYEGLSRDFSVQGWENYRQVNMVADVKRFGLDSELKVNDHFAKKSSEYVRSHPAAFAALAVRKLVKLYRLVPYEVFSLKARLMSVVFYVPLLVLTIAGVVLSRRNWELLLPLYLTIAYITVIHMIFTSQIRYRVPLQSFMALFAAFAVAALCARLTNKRSAL